MRNRLFLSFLFVMFSWIVISSLIAENDQSGSIDYEPEEFEDLCYGLAYVPLNLCYKFSGDFTRRTISEK